MGRFVREFILAAGFLTRLAPSRIAGNEELGRSLRWFPMVGLFLGILLTIPLASGLGAGRPWVQAWLWLGAALYVTRGLHWDGWVDLWDAWGSGARGPRFWDVLKDSRMGAFGGLGLFMGLAGYLILLQETISTHQWGVLIWAAVLGRSAAVLLAWQAKTLHRPGLGKTFLEAASGQCLLVVSGQAILVGILLVPWDVLLLAGLLCLGGTTILLRMAREQGGLNGDFLGAAIIWGELCVLVAWMVGGG